MDSGHPPSTVRSWKWVEQEMLRVVTDRLLALPGALLVVEVQPVSDVAAGVPERGGVGPFLQSVPSRGSYPSKTGGPKGGGAYHRHPSGLQELTISRVSGEGTGCPAGS